VPVGEPLAAEAGVVDGATLADAGDDVLQNAPVRRVVQHVARRHSRHPRCAGRVGEVLQARRVAGTPAQGQGHVRAVTEIGAQPSEIGGKRVVHFVRYQHGEHPRPVFDEVVPIETTGTLAGARLADAEQPAQPRVGRLVGGIDQHRTAVIQIEPAADDEAHVSLFGPLMRPDDARQRVAVDNAERRQPEQLRGREQLLHMAGAAQEAVVGRDLQLCVGGHYPGRSSSQIR